MENRNEERRSTSAMAPCADEDSVVLEEHAELDLQDSGGRPGSFYEHISE